jgi:hypothetical protein
MEQYEPPTPIIVMDTLDTDEQDLAGTARSAKRGRSTRIANRDVLAQPQGTAAMPATALCTPPRAARKRKSHSPSHPTCRSTRQYNTRSSTNDTALVDAEDRAEQIHSATESQERTTRLDQVAGSELARGLKLRGASHRPDPMSYGLYSTPTATIGAALVGAGDREAPHTHPVTTQREREAMLHHAAEQSPQPPSPFAASQRPCRPKLSRAR